MLLKYLLWAFLVIGAFALIKRLQAAKPAAGRHSDARSQGPAARRPVLDNTQDLVICPNCEAYRPVGETCSCQTARQ